MTSLRTLSMLVQVARSKPVLPRRPSTTIGYDRQAAHFPKQTACEHIARAECKGTWGCSGSQTNSNSCNRTCMSINGAQATGQIPPGYRAARRPPERCAASAGKCDALSTLIAFIATHAARQGDTACDSGHITGNILFVRLHRPVAVRLPAPLCLQLLEQYEPPDAQLC